MLTKKFCLQCGGDNIQMVAGGTIGVWMCADCGYSGSVFPERPLFMKEDDISKIKKKKIRGKK